jgi:hypothetical protein
MARGSFETRKEEADLREFAGFLTTTDELRLFQKFEPWAKFLAMEP